MMTDKFTDRLSEYLDGELAQDEREVVEAHLLECADCGRTLQQLRAVVARASQVIDRPPQSDLWPGIAERIAAAEPALDIEKITKRRLTFSIPQLAAASIVLMMMSAGTMYLMVNRDEAAPVAQGAAASPRGSVTSDQAVAAPVSVNSPAAANYNAAIDELETALQTGRSSLDTTTVRVLETNLRAIDVAISDARQALSRDPGNPYLNRYLDDTMQRKIQLLRRATGILRAQT